VTLMKMFCLSCWYSSKMILPHANPAFITSSFQSFFFYQSPVSTLYVVWLFTPFRIRVDFYHIDIHPLTSINPYIGNLCEEDSDSLHILPPTWSKPFTAHLYFALRNFIFPQ
jgi:hypothetical protein